MREAERRNVEGIFLIVFLNKIYLTQSGTGFERHFSSPNAACSSKRNEIMTRIFQVCRELMVDGHRKKNTLDSTDSRREGEEKQMTTRNVPRKLQRVDNNLGTKSELFQRFKQIQRI
ncbi:hypothetical protein NPIL_525921 [Nephila pilipes]|uniref:Uncharacterized protein n=1 Tax=Nephila pilipes TaxID=299642 RepID=A0A8X6PVZ1_NEPPI|nr:hypothetical protein NPIL_525921 [Nephila pilipes]